MIRAIVKFKPLWLVLVFAGFVWSPPVYATQIFQLRNLDWSGITFTHQGFGLGVNPSRSYGKMVISFQGAFKKHTLVYYESPKSPKRQDVEKLLWLMQGFARKVQYNLEVGCKPNKKKPKRPATATKVYLMSNVMTGELGAKNRCFLAKISVSPRKKLRTSHILNGEEELNANRGENDALYLAEMSPEELEALRKKREEEAEAAEGLGAFGGQGGEGAQAPAGQQAPQAGATPLPGAVTALLGKTGGGGGSAASSALNSLNTALKNQNQAANGPAQSVDPDALVASQQKQSALANQALSTLIGK